MNLIQSIEQLSKPIRLAHPMRMVKKDAKPKIKTLDKRTIKSDAKMVEVFNGESLTIKALAERMGVPQKNLNYKMKSMQNRGMIEIVGHDTSVWPHAAVYKLTYSLT